MLAILAVTSTHPYLLPAGQLLQQVFEQSVGHCFEKYGIETLMASLTIIIGGRCPTTYTSSSSLAAFNST